MTSIIHTPEQGDRFEEVFLFPASFAQQRLWFLHQLVPDSPFYNVVAGIRLEGQLDRSALQQAIQAIVDRHESLRTTFTVIEGELTQAISPEVEICISIIDLQTMSGDLEAIVQQLAQQEAKRSFDLSQDFPFRVTLFQLSPTQAVLLFVLHHIITDGWSMGILVRELSALYAAFRQNQSAALAPLAIQYADFAQWQRDWLQGDVLETQITYWRQHLQELPVLELPFDRPRSARQTYQGATQSIAFSPTLTQALIALSHRENVSLFMVVLAAFQTLLYRYSGQEKIVIGTPIANRHRSELEGVIGFFVNSLVLQTDLSENLTFRELLQRVREVAFGAYAHQDLPFEQLVQELQPQRDLSHHPLFQVALALQNTHFDPFELPGLNASQFELDLNTTRLDLEFHLWQTSDQLQGQITYSTDLFNADTIARMLTHFQTILEGIVSQPDQRLATLPILTLAEQQQLLVTWQQPHQPLPAISGIHHLFEQQAAQTPEAIAIIDEDQQLSYRALNQRSNQLAHFLRQGGIGAEQFVGIAVGRSIDMIVALLGVLKAGAAYLPLDPTLPQARLRFMCQDAGISLLLTQQQWLSQFTQSDFSPTYPILCLEQAWNSIAQYSPQNPVHSVKPTDLAYVIYTSGSTGQPKPVLIEHHGLCNLASAQRQIFNPQSSDRILQFASFSFDAAIFEIIMALQVGATLYLVRADSLVGARLVHLLCDRGITFVTLPPSLLRLLPVDQLPQLKTIISAGEACSSELVGRWTTGDRRFFNAYGPTEATVWSTVAELQPTHIAPTLGIAIANTQLYVLDQWLQPVPIGIPGELYIGGAGVARGYLKRPQLTAERFIPNPFTHDSTRLFKTGDQVRYRSDGSLEFLGRMDQQIKIRGYRIECGEIETILNQHDSIQAAAIVLDDSTEHQRLVAYVVLQAQHSLNPTALRHFLQQTLPTYMIPAVFIPIEALPLTANGKVDRAALRKTAHSLPVQPFMPPRTPTEKKLARIWMQLLEREQISLQDHFFEQGGDSLLAAQLIEQIQQQFQQNFPLSTLFMAPTIAQFAALIDQSHSQQAALSWSPLVPLKASRSERSFFCVHPVFGVVLPYTELARQLNPDQPFYGIQPFGLSSNHSAHRSIPDMAAAYIQAIQTVQPESPYLLGGWSFGGLVAFEMAQQLQQAGHEVALLAIFDTIAPIPASQPSRFTVIQFLVKTVLQSIFPFLWDYLSLLRSQHRSRSTHFHTKKSTYVSWFSRWQWATIANLLPQESRLRLLDEITLLPMLRVFQCNSRAVQQYKPSVYSGKITLFKAAEAAESQQDPTLGWNQLTTEPVEVHQIPGNHLTLLRKPHVQEFAAQLQHCIDRTISSQHSHQ
ncbi:MAG TPA: amino acid adenylation domain-containing protein [Trichocoleus sp.]|jgi:amino acid adenylation domain-containing protein